jgi:DNA-binding XRE family transcriptional regulator
MSKTLGQKLNQLSPERKKIVEARAVALIAEEGDLQKLRKAHKLTQANMAKKLGIGQDSVSRLEQRSDLLISTLRSYVEAMGGKLSIVAEFPDRRPVVLTGLANLETGPPAARR